jgi:hypothetical protein
MPEVRGLEGLLATGREELVYLLIATETILCASLSNLAQDVVTCCPSFIKKKLQRPLGVNVAICNLWGAFSVL